MMKNDSRSPEEIEREIERERAGLTDALDGLQNKFSVESIARQVSDQFREITDHAASECRARCGDSNVPSDDK